MLPEGDCFKNPLSKRPPIPAALAILNGGRRSSISEPDANAGNAAQNPNLLPFHFNDHGNAVRLEAYCAGKLKYVHPKKKWQVWDGYRYAVDDVGQANRMAKEAMLEFLRQAIAAGNVDAEKFALRSLDARRIAAMLSMAESEIFVRPDELDTDRYALNCRNGTVDLRNSTIRPHKQSDLITKLVHHDFHPESKCPLWSGFLARAMGGGPDASESENDMASRRVDHLQRAWGYSITADTTEKAVFMMVGEAGNNGKTTMGTTIRQVVPEYSVLIQVDTLMVRQESNNTQADLADLCGARIALTSETENGQQLAQGKLKRITQGMGKIKTCRKYEHPIEFPETHKLWIDTNRAPTVRDADDQATFNRLHIIPFAVSIPRDQIDRQFPVKLLAEAEGILAWLVEGARLWYQDGGLRRPAEFDAAKDEWRAQMDQVGRFVEECCIVGESCRSLGSALYSEYKRWSEAAGEHPITGTAFGRKISQKFEKRHSERGATYLGIGVRA